MFWKEYLCSCNAFLWFDFKECLGDDIPVYVELPCNDYFGDDEELDAIDQTEQIFDFLDVPSFVSLFSENQNEPMSRLQKKAQLKKILLIHMVNSLVIVKGFWKDFIWNCQDWSTLAKKNSITTDTSCICSRWYLRRNYWGFLFRCSTF